MHAIAMLDLVDVDDMVAHTERVIRDQAMAGEPVTGPRSVGDPYDRPAAAARFRASWSKPLDEPGWARAWGLRVGGTLVGHCGLRSGGLASELHRVTLGVAIERAARGRGAGRALIETAIAFARHHRLSWIDLGVFSNNQRARQLYRKLGFVEVGAVTDRFRVDGAAVTDIAMVLDLRAHDAPPRGEPLFHITTRLAWNHAQAGREYHPPSLAGDGCIHLATEQQWRHVLHRKYRGQPDTVVLTIAPDQLAAPVRFVDSDGERYPRLYGPLPTASVITIRDAPRVVAVPAGVLQRATAADRALDAVVACEVTVVGRPTVVCACAPKRGSEGQIVLDAVRRAAHPEFADAVWMQLHSLPRLGDDTLDEVALLMMVETLAA